MSNTMSFSAYINGNYISVSHHIGQLRINKVNFKFPHHICSMSLSPNKIFVVHSNIRLDDGFHTFDGGIQKNNIEAYDYSGNLVWRISDVWENSKTITEEMRQHGIYFCEVNWHTGKTLIDVSPKITDQWNSLKTEFEICPEHEYLECQSFYDPKFIIDLTKGEIVHITVM